MASSLCNNRRAINAAGGQRFAEPSSTGRRCERSGSGGPRQLGQIRLALQADQARQAFYRTTRAHDLQLEVHDGTEQIVGPARPGDEEKEGAERVATRQYVPGADQP